jgi:formate dehydrogenase iron-sulfur subunit
VLGAAADQKYIVCNADEGDSGTFSDRMLMEAIRSCLIEGMTIAGARRGCDAGLHLPALRVSARRAHALSGHRRARARRAGRARARRRKRSTSSVRIGAGAYICGEETALLESLEGKRGMVRFKPPLPAICGLFGKPTVINNVITLASVP